jgi:hypothetical protein
MGYDSSQQVVSQATVAIGLRHCQRSKKPAASMNLQCDAADQPGFVSRNDYVVEMLMNILVGQAAFGQQRNYRIEIIGVCEAELGTCHEWMRWIGSR